MILVDNFYNKVLSELDGKYFPNVKYYGDNKKNTKLHCNMELFSNGCLAYEVLIERIAKNCNDSEENLNNIVSKYIVD